MLELIPQKRCCHPDPAATYKLSQILLMEESILQQVGRGYQGLQHSEKSSCPKFSSPRCPQRGCVSLPQDINRGPDGAPSRPLSLAQSLWPHDCQLVQREADFRRRLPIVMETKAGAQHPAAPRNIAHVLLLGSKSSGPPPAQHAHTYTHTHTPSNQQLNRLTSSHSTGLFQGTVSPPAGGRRALWPEKPVPVVKDSQSKADEKGLRQATEDNPWLSHA